MVWSFQFGRPCSSAPRSSYFQAPPRPIHHAARRYPVRAVTRRCGLWIHAAVALALIGLAPLAALASASTTALVRHAPRINSARVEGSLQQLLGESVNLNGGATITGNFLVPGTPNLVLNGNPVIGGNFTGSGPATPSGYQVLLNGGVLLGGLVTRAAPADLPVAPVPDAPVGTRSVTLNNANQSPGNFTTLRHLALNGNAGERAIPPGAYGDFTANGGTGFVLGVAGASTRAVYHFQRLILNGHSALRVVGPVEVRVAAGFTANGRIGVEGRCDWLTLAIRSGGLTLNGNSEVHAVVIAPSGEVIINGNSRLVGGVASDRLTLNGNGLLRLECGAGGGGEENLPPTAAPVSAVTPEDQPVAVTLAGTDPEGGPLAFAVETGPGKGPFHGNLSGTAPNLVYTPHTHYFGPDSFTYTASDGTSSSAPAAVSVTVAPVNDLPVAIPRSVITQEDTAVSATLFGEDVDGDPLAFHITRSPAHGTLTTNASSPVSTLDFTYDPAAGYHGEDEFAFVVRDGTGNSTEALVSITVASVNDAPVAAPQSVTVAEDAWLPITLAAFDEDNQPLVYTIDLAPGHGTLHGTAPNLTYCPTVNFFGPDLFIFRVTDPDNASSTANISITVLPVNDAPVGTPLAVGVDEDAAIDLLLSATDVDSANLTFEILTPPAHGTLDPTPGTPGSPVQSPYTYTPAGNYFGPDEFVFQVSDNQTVSDPVTATITVRPVNDPPAAASLDLATPEDTPLTVTLAGADIDNDALRFRITSGPSNGTLALVTPQTEILDPHFLYTPAANFTGTDTIRYAVNDGTTDSPEATVNITVSPANDPPTVEAGANGTVFVPGPFALAGTVQDDSPEITVQWVKVSGPGPAAFEPANRTVSSAFFGSPGTYVLRLIADDGEFQAQDDLTVTVQLGNQPPSVQAGPDLTVNSDAVVTLAGNVTDDGQPAPTTLTSQWRVVSGPGSGSFANASNTATTVTFSQPGTYLIRLSATDGQLAGADDLAVRVLPVNQAPSVSAGPDKATELQTAVSLGGSASDDGLPTGSVLHTSWTQLGGPGAALFASIESPTSEVRFTVPGTYVLQIEATDGAASVTDTVTVTVDPPPNRAPVVDAGPDQALTLSNIALLQATVSDDGLPANGTLTTTWETVAGPAPVSITDPSSQGSRVVFAEAGTYRFRITANDGELAAADEIQVEYAGENQAPEVTVTGDSDIFLGQPSTLSGIVADDGLPAGSAITLAWTLVSGPGQATFAQPGSISTLVGFDQPGDYVVRLTASDGSLEGSAVHSISVLANQPPTVALAAPAAGTVFSVLETVHLVANAADADGQVVRVEFFADGRSIGEDLEAPFELLWETPGPGVYTLTACATDDRGAVAASDPDTDRIRGQLDQLRWELPFTAPWNSVASFCPFTSIQQAALEGAPGVLYDLSVQIRGLVEYKPYTGGTEIAPGWYAGGAPVPGDGWNIYRLEVSNPPQVYYLNRGQAQVTEVFPVDVTGSFQAYGDAVITLSADSLDGYEIMNYRNIVVPGVPPAPAPYSGQFLQMDVLDAASAASTTIEVRAGCTPRPEGLAHMWNGDTIFQDPIGGSIPVSYNIPGVVPGLVGTAFVYQPYNYLDTGVTPAASELPLTVEAWVRPALRFDGTDFPNNVVSTDIPGSYGMGFGVNVWPSGSQLKVEYHNGFRTIPGVGFAADQWAHVAVVYLPGEIRTYVNGVGVDTFTGFAQSPISAPRWFRVGFHNHDPAHGSRGFFSGLIDELSVYRRALQDGEIKAIHRAGSSGKCADETNHAPAVNAGPDLELPTGYVPTLVGSVTDDNLPAGVLTVSWTVRSGPGPVAFQTSGAPSSTAAFAVPGDYLLALSASDGAASSEDTVSVRVLAPNDPPPSSGNGIVVGSNAGPDQAVSAGSLVTLDGSASTTTGPGPLAFQWTQVSGPTVALSDGSAAHPHFIAPGISAPTELRFRLFASDGIIVGGGDEVAVTIVPGGQPANTGPVADAGPDQIVAPGAVTLLAGTATDDGLPVPANLLVRWSCVAGPVAPAFVDVASAQTAVTFPVPGNYTLRFQVSDGQFIASDQCTVVVSAAVSNQPPAVDAGLSLTLSAPGTAQLSGSVQDDGLPQDTLSSTWMLLSGPAPVGFGNVTALSTSAHFPVAGHYVLALTASDSELSAYDTLTVEVLAGPNAAPTVDLGSDVTISLGQSANIPLSLWDDGLPAGLLTYGLLQTSGPANSTLLDEGTNWFRLGFSIVGTYVIRAEVSDGELAGSDEVTITVNGGSNQPPTVQLTAPAPAATHFLGRTLDLVATASDTENQLLRVEFYDGATLLGATSEFDTQVSGFRSQVSSLPLGQRTLTAVAVDNLGQRTTSTPVGIQVVLPAPTVRIAIPADGAQHPAGSPLVINAVTTSSVPVTRVDFFLNGQPAGSDTTSPYAVTLDTASAGALPATWSLTATVHTTDGQTATSAPITAHILDPDTIPEALLEIASPLPGATITAPTTVTGTVQLPNLASWTLEAREANAPCGDWEIIASGTQSVNNGTLGEFDPTLRLNGLHELRLTARDTAGRIYTLPDAVPVVLEGGMKVGHFTVAFNDLELPLSGLPITVTRTYDSRRRCVGDFGPGWNLDVSTLSLEINRPLSDGWSVYADGDPTTGLRNYLLRSDAPHRIALRMPDGNVMQFRPRLQMRDGFASEDGTMRRFVPPGLPADWMTLHFTPVPGTTGTLEALDANGQPPSNLLLDSATVTYPDPVPKTLGREDGDGFIEPWNPSLWRYTAKDGRAFTFDTDGRLLRMADTNGNTVSFTRNGEGRVEAVVHSAGPSLTIHRDFTGRIDWIEDPRGNRTLYHYDLYGRLEKFFDRQAAQSAIPSARFAYKGSTNLLADIFTPASAGGTGVVRAIRNEYDDVTGRLWKTIDAEGRETVFTHNIAGRTETITDRAGNTTTHTYDNHGNVVQTVTPDGTVTTMTYHTWPDGRTSDLKTVEQVSGLFTTDSGQLAHGTRTTLYAYEDDDPQTPPANDGLLRKITDPLGHTTRFTYDERGNPLTLTDARGSSTTNSYYPGTSRVHTTTDPLGNTVTHTYDAQGNPDKETRSVTLHTVADLNAPGTPQVQTLVTDHDYDAQGRLEKTTDPNGHVTTYDYDTNGNQRFVRTTRSVSAVAGGGAPGSVVPVVTETEYDANDRPIKTWNAENPRIGAARPSSETIYDDAGRVWKTIDALGRITEQRYTARGEPWKIIHPDGTADETLYDADGRREWSIDRMGRRTKFVYDSLGRLSETWFCGTGTAPLVRLSKSEYDAAGRVWKSTDARGKVTTQIYDAAGRRVAAINALNQRSDFTYDANGNLETFTDARRNTVQHIYDNLNRRTRTVFPAAEAWTGSAYEAVATDTFTDYDEFGRRTVEYEQAPVSVPKTARTAKRFGYDALGRLRSVSHHSSAAPQLSDTLYGYDELGNQLTQTDALGRTTTYTYDNLGRRITRILPLGQTEQVEYDEAGNTRFRTDFNGRTTEFQYDEMNRPRFRIPDPAFAGEPTVAWTYWEDGQRKTMSDASGLTRYFYDTRGRLESKEAPQGTIGYTHDDAGNVESIDTSTPDGASMAYTYDDLNRLETVTDLNDQTTEYGYDLNGSLRRVSLPNGLTSIYDYSATNRLASLTVTNLGASTVASYLSKIHPTGHRRQMQEGVGSSMPARTVSYSYDSMWRLRGEQVSAPAPAPSGATSWDLDLVGNRLAQSSTIPGIGTQTFTPDANDRLNTDQYDANGNTLQGALHISPQSAIGNPQSAIAGTDTYDSFDRLIRRTAPNGDTISITYNGDGQRVSKTVTRNGIATTTSWLVDDLNPTGYSQVIEERTNSVLTAVYTYGHDLISQDRDIGLAWTVSYFGYDPHGNVRYLTDAAGQITDTFDYDAFGQLIARTGLTKTNYLYCGEEIDPDLVLSYNRARYLNLGSGRFWSMDSYEGQGAAPIALHKYLYAEGQPVTGTDPNGLFTLAELNSAALNVGRFAVHFIARAALPTTSIPQFMLRVMIGTTTTYISNDYADYYMPGIVTGLDEVAAELERFPSTHPNYASAQMLATRARGLAWETNLAYAKIKANIPLGPFFWSQLGWVVNMGHLAMQGARIGRSISDAEECVAEAASLVGINAQVELDKKRTLGRLLFRTADPATDLWILGQGLAAEREHRSSSRNQWARLLAERLGEYATVRIQPTSPWPKTR